MPTFDWTSASERSLLFPRARRWVLAARLALTGLWVVVPARCRDPIKETTHDEEDHASEPRSFHA